MLSELFCQSDLDPHPTKIPGSVHGIRYRSLIEPGTIDRGPPRVEPGPSSAHYPEINTCVLFPCTPQKCSVCPVSQHYLCSSVFFNCVISSLVLQKCPFFLDHQNTWEIPSASLLFYHLGPKSPNGY